jgi:hypothetical protein
VRTCRVSPPSSFSTLSLDLILAPEHGTTGIPAGGNPFAWLLNAMIVMQIAPSGVVPPPLAPGLAQSDRIAKLSTKRWHWIGPFDDADGLGLDTLYPPEHELLKSEAGVSLNSTYTGKDGHTIRWAQYEAPATARAPHLPLGKLVGQSQSEGTSQRGSVAFGFVQVFNAGASRNVSFFGSISGQGKLYVRQATVASATLVYSDPSIRGLEEAEDQGLIELGHGWNELLVKSVHSFEADMNHNETGPLHFPSFVESERYAQAVGLVERHAEWGAFLAFDL